MNAWHVEWFLDGDAILQDVTLLIAEGRVHDIVSGCASDAVDLGHVALIPGLVNAHTHLEFSLVSQPIPTSGRFTDWIRSVVAYRRNHGSDPTAAIRTGVAESLRAGTTLIGEIATTGWNETAYSAAGFTGCVFLELLGIGDERVTAQCTVAKSLATKQGSVDSQARQVFGLSPHAPYSVHPDLFARSVQIAEQNSLPVAVHLAETEAELELLANGTGEFRELLTDFGIWRDGIFGGKKPLDYLQGLAGCSQVLIIHGNYLDDEELQFLAAHPNMTLVYCPRTHAAFGHRAHPWQRVVELGGRVAIGTDSRASNPDLSLFAELQFMAAENPDFSHLELLELGSHAGRAAIFGEASQASADFCLVEWGTGELDPVQDLFSPRCHVIGTMVGGEWHSLADRFRLLVPNSRSSILGK